MKKICVGFLCLQYSLLYIYCINHNILPLGYPCESLRLTHSNNSLYYVSSPIEVGNCRPGVSCINYANSKYRTLDGKCNNLNIGKSLWGSKGSIFTRLTSRATILRENYPPTFFFEGKDRPLPNARDVSSQVHSGTDSTFSNITIMLMQMGQFIDHDLTLTEETNLCEIDKCPASTRIDCCDFIDFKTFKSKNFHHACMPILVSETDAFYSKIYPKIRCLDFKVSKTARSCHDESNEPYNSLTSFLDGSHIYGSDEEQSHKLRALSDGLMIVNSNNQLPVEMNECPQMVPSFFLAGDVRVNENPGLSAMHTIWLREHNRIARELFQLHPQWNSEKLYQESRRWVVAQWQHVVYNEFLPIVFGSDFVALSDSINVQKDSYYNPEISPDILISFSTAAFRFGHSLISADVEMYLNGSEFRHLDLATQFFNTTEMQSGKFDRLLEGMWYQHSEQVNSKISGAVRNFLFRKERDNFGSDLAARNIQRGRDHALPPYETFRLICGLTPLPKSFSSSPPDEFTLESWKTLSRVYSEPGDIELFPGGMSEIPRGSALIGPTFFCIIYEQFQRTRLGDRYFYTHVNVPKSIGFCEDEKKEIRSRRLSDIICDNSELSTVALDVFRSGREDNILDCKYSRKLNVAVHCPIEYNHDTNEQEVSTNGMVALLVGGFDGNELLNSVELYSPIGTCQYKLPNFPIKVNNIYLQYLESEHILACGGRVKEGSQKTCWRLNLTSLEWEPVPHLSLRYPRWLSGSSMLLGDWVLSGGHDSPTTIEILATWNDFLEWTWKMGPRLPANGRKQHCMVIVREEMYIFGGFHTGMNIQKYNFRSRQWTSLPSSLLYYRFKHDCLLLPNEETVFIMGRNVGTIFNVSSGKLTITDSSLDSRNFGSVIRLGDRVFVIGGSKYLHTVEEYHYKNKSYSIIPFNIDQKRSRFGITAVPSRVFQKHFVNCKG